MISKRIEDLLNKQFNMELFSANLYLAMSSYFMSRDLDGFANFFRIQAQEEQQHAMKQFDYVHQVDGRILFTQVDAPQNDFDSILHVFELTLAHEKKVTASINNIVGAALDEKDYATHSFLQWFITEQVEEEASIKSLIQKIKMIGDNSSALYLMNTELMQRNLENAN